MSKGTTCPANGCRRASSRRTEAQYWIGRTEFYQANYAQARADLESQLSTYGATNPFADIVNIYIGRCDYETAQYSLATARS